MSVLSLVGVVRRHSSRLVMPGLGAALILTTWNCGRVGNAAVKSWAVASGPWGAGGNWSPVGVPGAADDVLIGPHINASNETVTLSADASVDSVTLTDGMTLRTSTSFLNVAGGTQVSGQNIVGPSTYTSRLRIEDGGLGLDFTTGNLSLSNFGRATLESAASMQLSGVLTIADTSSLSGNGSVYLTKNSGTALDNDGRIEATVGGLTIFQTAGGRIDLDGAGGQGLVVVNSGGGNGLEINGDQLTDAFSGDIEMTSNSRLEMNLTNGWSAGSGSSLPSASAA